MAHRSTLPARIVFTGNRTRGQRYVAYGRTLLGSVVEAVESSDIESHFMRRVIGDATITARYGFGDAVITIDVPFLSSEASSSFVFPAAWIPEGFVVYPISDTAVKGWGVPSLDVDLGNRYAAPNLAPGLDVDRWTIGGQLGEVLLTTLPNAGYPDENADSLRSPLLFHPVYGLRPQKPFPDRTSTWAAYRLEFTDYSAQNPNASVFDLPVATSFKRKMFELVNELRVADGRDPLMLPIRGYYDSAQATTEVMAAAQIVGHFSEEFAPTYETEDDRGSKDGILRTGRAAVASPAQWDDRNFALSVGENLTGSPGGPQTILGIDPVGREITRMPPGPTLTAQQCFDQFLTSAAHTANMKAAQYDFGGAGAISATSLGVGFHTAYYGQHFVQRDHWIAAGNCYWLPADSDIPVVSWDGFNALNLAWETWPIRFTVDLEEFTAAAYLGRYFTASNGTASDGAPAADQAVLVYSDLVAAGEDRRYRLSMSSRVYMRGRCIGVAPHGSLVWGAVVQKLPLEANESQKYRLVVLTHHSADQGDQTVLTSGVTKILRVWYIDLPDVLDLAANPVTPVRGVYGEEDLPDDWPWITTNSLYSWRGGAAVNVTDGDTLLKYASQWKFSADGTKAVCLRDYGTVSDYETEYMYSQCDPPGAGVYGATLNVDYLMSGQLGVFTGGRWVKYVELDLSDATAPSLFVSDVNFGATPHKMATSYSAASVGGTVPVAWIRPAAVDYDVNGALIFAHHVIGFYPGAYETAGAAFGSNINNSRHGIYFTSDWDATWHTAAPTAAWYSTVVALPGEPYMGALASVIDVRDKVWAHLGTPCSAVDTGAIAGAHPDYPLYVSESAPDSLYRSFDFTAECLACTQIPAEHVIRMYRNGVLLLENTTPNDDDLVHDFRLFPNLDPRFMPWSLNPALQATYAKDQTGAWVATLAYIPQVAECFRFTPDGSPGAETYYWDYPHGGENQCYNSCGEGWQASTRPVTGFSQTKNGGGGMISSFASNAELADLMQVEGTSPRSPFVRIV